MDIILAYRKSIQIDDDNTWVKSYIDKFYVTKGSFNSAQIAHFVGIYIVDTLGGRFINLPQIGLYKYDGLIFIPKTNRPKTPKLQKKNYWGILIPKIEN